MINHHQEATMDQSEPSANDHHHYNYDTHADPPRTAVQTWATRIGWTTMIIGALVAVAAAVVVGDTERATILRMVVAAYAITTIGLLCLLVGRHRGGNL